MEPDLFGDSNEGRTTPAGDLGRLPAGRLDRPVGPLVIRAMTPSDRNADQEFFFRNAGWSYNPETQTAEEGRDECARRLAFAESVYLAAHIWTDCAFVVEPDPDLSGYAAFIRCNGDVLASVGGIEDAPGADYYRVVRAELALECLDELANRAQAHD